MQNIKEEQSMEYIMRIGRAGCQGIGAPPIMSDEKIKRWATQNIFSNDPELLVDLRCMARECIDQAARIKELEEALEYYADESNYEPWQSLHGERPAAILKMRTKLAREALQDKDKDND